jgi:hypothetical protein
MATSPYQYYLEVISKWPTAIAPESQWFMYFDIQTVGTLKNNVSELLKKYDSGSGSDTVWNIPQSTISTLISKENQYSAESLIGCVFAREARVPSDGLTAGNIGLDYGGYQAPATAGKRDQYGKLHIVFTETNSSFIDFVIRPWIIATSYFGLIARNPNSQKNVKCNYVDVVYLAKTGSFNPSIPRKVVRFFGVAPVKMSSVTNTYASEGLQYNGVDFVYDSYAVLDPSNSGNTIQAPSASAKKASSSTKNTGSVTPTGGYTPAINDFGLMAQQQKVLPSPVKTTFMSGVNPASNYTGTQ